MSADEMCGDYPAPCNCDDPETHDGAVTAADRPTIPRVGDTITTAEQLDALWDRQDVLIEATGTYSYSQRGTFAKCWARPVPEFVGGERGTWEVLAFGTEMPHSLTTSDRIVSAAVLYVPGEQTREGVGTGAGEGDDPAPTEATSWVTRSTDCPEAPAQAHPRPSVTDNARAIAERRWIPGTFPAWLREAGWAAGRAETTTEDYPDAEGLAALRENAETTTATTEDAEQAVVDALGQSPFAHHEVIPSGETASTLYITYDDEWTELASLIVQMLASRGLLATARTRPTETEWGVRWRPDDYEAAPDEDTARLWAASDTGHPVALVRREVTAWTEADR